MNLHAASAYAMHLLTARSTAGHGVHSPFMFRFITEVIGGRSDRAIMAEVESLRREMLSDNRVVSVTDLGAGSSVMRGNERIIKQNGPKHGGEQIISQDASLRAGDLPTQQTHCIQDRDKSISQDASLRREERSIRQIASAAAVPKREAALLARIAASLDMTRAEKSENGQHTVVNTGAGEQPGMDTEATQQKGTEAGAAQRPGKDTEATQQKEAEAGAAQRPGKETEAAQQRGTEAGAELWPGAGTRAMQPQRGTDAGPEDRPVILELGSSLGISTLALALAAPLRKVISVEGCPELAAIACANLLRHGVQNAEVICMEFGDALTELKNKGIKVALAFIDGNHRGAALTEYVHKIRQMGEEITIVADDIHMNRDMIKAWRSIVSGSAAGRPAITGILSAGKAQPNYETPAGPAPASLETLRTGMLFCLPTITPGHYRVRY